jgi:hypothetical protein
LRRGCVVACVGFGCRFSYDCCRFSAPLCRTVRGLVPRGCFQVALSVMPVWAPGSLPSGLVALERKVLRNLEPPTLSLSFIQTPFPFHLPDAFPGVLVVLLRNCATNPAFCRFRGWETESLCMRMSEGATPLVFGSLNQGIGILSRARGGNLLLPAVVLWTGKSCPAPWLRCFVPCVVTHAENW